MSCINGSDVLNAAISTQTVEQFPFGVNEKLNITASVLSIYHGVPLVDASNMSCCDYTNQILDPFCASQSTVSALHYITC